MIALLGLAPSHRLREVGRELISLKHDQCFDRDIGVGQTHLVAISVIELITTSNQIVELFYTRNW